MTDVAVITDAKGRKITLRKLSVLDQVKLLRAIGPAQAENQPYSMMVNVAAMVADIDGVPQPMPTNERQIDAAISRLDDDGFAAVAVYMRRQMEEIEAAAEAASKAADGETAPDPLQASAS